MKDSGADLRSVVSVDGKTLRGIHGEDTRGALVSAYAADCWARVRNCCWGRFPWKDSGGR